MAALGIYLALFSPLFTFLTDTFTPETPWTTFDERHHHHHHQHRHKQHNPDRNPMPPAAADPSTAICRNSNTTTTGTEQSSYYYPPTVAAFSPSHAAQARRPTFQVHQKSPLLVATPPQVTRALSKAYPWIKTADYALGLLTWTTGDPWESFLVVAFFWGAALYGGWLLRWAGNVVAVVALIAAMFARRYGKEETTTLDEILAALNSLNMRVEVFEAPFFALLELLSAQKNATAAAAAATKRPALTTLFLRILLLTPLWLFVSVYPLQILTPRRIVVFSGTLFLTWHSRPAKVSRTILWRSTMLRKLSEQVTGLSLTPRAGAPPPLPPHEGGTVDVAAASSSVDKPTPFKVATTAASPGVRFTFAIYENQRRWLGVGWTCTLFAYERAAWTDEYLQPCPPPHEFSLPETAHGSGVAWRWVPGEEWEVEGAADEHRGKKRAKQEIKDRLGGPGESGEGWWYYDNKWRDGRRGVDGWGKYTRRRKWTRRAELVEADQVQVEEKVDEPAVTAVELDASQNHAPWSLPPRGPPPPSERETKTEGVRGEAEDACDSSSVSSDYGDDDDAAHRRQAAATTTTTDGGVRAG